MVKFKSAAKPQPRGNQERREQSQSEAARRTAADFEELRSRFDQFTVDELAQIPIIESGLRPGAVYLDLKAVDAPFTASGLMKENDKRLYAAEAETPKRYWDRLVAALGSSGAARTTINNEVAEEAVDQALEDSFPTSDPPAWTTGREPKKPAAPEAPREKRVEPENK